MMLVGTLGHKVFDEKRSLSSAIKKDIFYLSGARGADAIGETNPDGFLVFKGSKAAINPTKSYTNNFVKYRETLLDQDIFIIEENHLVFKDDFIFSSPSTAASIILARNANGLTEWKLKDGRTLKEYETKK